MDENELLDKLAAMLNKNYLSDLRNVLPRDLLAAVQKLDVTMYSVDHWGYTLSYIFGEDIKIGSYSDIALMLGEKENMR